MNRRERRAAGLQKSSSHPKTVTPAELHEAGSAHLRAGRLLEGQKCCQQLLAADPKHVGALHLMGLISLQARQYDHAIEWIARASQLDVQTDYLGGLGSALLQQGLHAQAFAALVRAIEFRPNDPELWKQQGCALFELKRFEPALASFLRALELNARFGEAGYWCGRTLHRLGRLEEAFHYLSRCNELHPDNKAVLGQRALVLHELKRFEQALVENQRILELDPANPEACNNIGAALHWLGRDAEALPWFDRALSLKPDFVEADNNKASSLTALHRFDEAIDGYRRVKTIDPTNVVAEWDLALLHMLTGNFAAGWAGREARWKLPVFRDKYPKFSQPIWLGAGEIAGKTILIYADEGLGDAIQFARYIPMLAARGARVILVVERALHPLLRGLPGVAECFVKSPLTWPAFDLHCPMSSLPLAFATQLETIPVADSCLPLVAADRKQAWEDRLGPRDKLRVGLVWSGNPTHFNDRNRSIPLRMLIPLLEADATFFSLQKDPRPDDQATLREQNELIDLTEHLTDFVETAAFVSCLDVVVTVDTSVAHLAAALGRETWILLPYTPDYRWLLGRDDSPWYPTVRLFRQSETREYATVLSHVKTELAGLAARLAS